MNIISSIKHEIRINSVNKLAFSSYDSKRYIFPCGIHSVPYGHYILKENKNCPHCNYKVKLKKKFKI